MILILLLASTCNITFGSISEIGHVNLLLLQGRITLPTGGVGGVTFTPDPAITNRSYQHTSRPLFGPEVSRAAQQASRRYTSKYTPAAPQLISSREVATEAVRRSLYGRRWGW